MVPSADGTVNVKEVVMSSIFDLVSSQLSGDTMARIGAKIGQDPQATQKGVESALAVLVGGLNKSSQKDGGAGLAQNSRHDTEFQRQFHPARADPRRRVRSGDCDYAVGACAP